MYFWAEKGSTGKERESVLFYVLVPTGSCVRVFFLFLKTSVTIVGSCRRSYSSFCICST